MLNSEVVFLIRREDADDDHDRPSEYQRLTAYRSLRIYETTSDAIPAVGPGYGIARYLDRFFLVVPVDRATDRQDTLDLFFSWLAPRYEQAIDVARNIDNIQNLLALLQLPALATVLDFGCGTGLAHEYANGLGITVVGFDTCDVMRGIASLKGMRTITPSSLLADEFVVDAIIASYVVHLRPASIWVQAAWKHLRAGGAFVCNIHKSTGLSEFLEVMESLGASVTVHSDSPHGPYVVCRKAIESAAP